jgi:hypothetical protein
MIMTSTAADGTRTIVFDPPGGPHRVVVKTPDGKVSVQRVGIKSPASLHDDPSVVAETDDVRVTPEMFDRLWTMR